MSVSNCKSDNTTYYRAGLIDSGSIFDADHGCNSCRMTRGLQCTRFEVRTDFLLWICYKGVHCMQDVTIYLCTAFEINCDSLDWGKYNIQQSARVR